MKKLADFARCLFGLHCVPKNRAFESYGAVFAGGICPRCGKLKQGKFLGNVWTTEIRRTKGPNSLKGRDISFATDAGYEVTQLY